MLKVDHLLWFPTYILRRLQKELSYEGYLEYKAHKEAPPPLTSAEEEIKFLDDNEVNISYCYFIQTFFKLFLGQTCSGLC